MEVRVNINIVKKKILAFLETISIIVFDEEYVGQKIINGKM